MKFSRIAALVTSCILSVTSLRIVPVQKVHAADTIAISPYNAYQINDGRFEGWGTSLCWWANRVGYSDSLAQQTAEAFFGDSGLRMNIARYNIGGGDDPSHTHITRTDSDIPGYTEYRNGQVIYNWDADSRQRNVLMKSIDACSDGLIVEMFSNSPPYYMTNSGCSSGNTDGGKNNLKDDCYDDFAEYFATVCEHFQNDWGVEIQSVAPMNEPYTNYWYAGSPKQEGCHFDIGNSESTVITELDKAMQRHGLGDVIISASDETSIDTAIDAYNALSADAKRAVGRIDTHTYGGSKRSQLKDLALKSGMNLWMSEVDGGATAGKDNGQMGAALWLAERMAIDLNGMNPSAWILWQAIDKHICAAGFNGKKDSGMPDINGGFWGLAVADHDNDSIILTKKYYAFGQYSRFIRPGFTMLNVSGSNVAAYDEENHQLVIVCVNTSGDNRDLYFDLAQFDSIGDSVSVVRTSGDVQTGENWKELAPITTQEMGFSASLLANSVTTYIIDDVKTVSADLEEIPLSSDMVTGSDSWKNDSATSCLKTVDGDYSTYFDGLGNGYVQIDLGDSYDISAVGIVPRSGYAYRCVDAVISCSEDGENWTEACVVKNPPFDGLNYFTHLAANKSIRYIRYQTPAGAPSNPYNKDDSYCCNLAEIKVFGSPADREEKIPLTADMVTGSDPWKGSTDDCTKVVDGKNNTYFDGVKNGWIQVDLGKRCTISAIGFVPREGYEFRCVDAVISASTDGVNWKEIHTITALPSKGINYITSDQPFDARYIRYQVPDGAPANPYNQDDVYCCNLAEISVYGAESAAVRGDVDADGALTVADAVMLQKWLHGSGELTAPENADLCEDGAIDIFDLGLLRQALLEKSA